MQYTTLLLELRGQNPDQLEEEMANWRPKLLELEPNQLGQLLLELESHEDVQDVLIDNLAEYAPKQLNAAARALLCRTDIPHIIERLNGKIFFALHWETVTIPGGIPIGPLPRKDPHCGFYLGYRPAKDRWKHEGFWTPD